MVGACRKASSRVFSSDPGVPRGVVHSMENASTPYVAAHSICFLTTLGSAALYVMPSEGTSGVLRFPLQSKASNPP